MLECDDEELVKTEFTCVNCESEGVIVHEEETKPQFCPFCSEPLE